MVVTGVVVIAVFGSVAMKEGFGKTPLGNKFLKVIGSDWLKALLLMLLGPFFLVYLFFALIHQASRKCFSFTKKLEDSEKRQIFTTRAEIYLKQIRAWNWTSVFIKSIWIGILVFLLMVGVTRIVTLFLSWLNQQLL